MLWLVLAGWIVIGIVVAWVMNASFDLGGPIDPGANGSNIVPKWLILVGIVLLWPFAPLVALFVLLSWVAGGSH